MSDDVHVRLEGPPRIVEDELIVDASLVNDTDATQSIFTSLRYGGIFEIALVGDGVRQVDTQGPPRRFEIDTVDAETVLPPHSALPMRATLLLPCWYYTSPTSSLTVRWSLHVLNRGREGTVEIDAR